MYHFVNTRGHILVYDGNGTFLFSADNEKEARAVRKKIMDKLDKLKIGYEIVTSSEDHCERIACEIAQEVKKNEQ